MQLPETPYSIAEAIAREEGFYDNTAIPNRPQRNNNPGDLEFHPWMTEFGATCGDPRFAIFPAAELGMNCLERLLTFKMYKGKTLMQMAELFAPGTENNTTQYALNLSAWTELPLDTVIDNYITRSQRNANSNINNTTQVTTV